MSVNFNFKRYITVFATNFSYLLKCFLLTELQDLGTLQDQNQGRPRVTRTHCGWMG